MIIQIFLYTRLTLAGSFTQSKDCTFAKGYAPGPHASHTFACAFLSPDAIYFSIPNLKIVKGKNKCLHLQLGLLPSLSVISRSNGSSSVASAAYRACVKLYDKLWDKVHDYTPKKGQIFTEIFGNFNGSIEELWNAAEAADTRKIQELQEKL